MSGRGADRTRGRGAGKRRRDDGDDGDQSRRRLRVSGDDRWPVGTTVAVKFGKTTYTAQVTRTLPRTNEDPPLWHVLYEDNDEEDLDEDEMIKAYNLYANGDSDDDYSSENM